jgi:hypothetical protein
MNNSACNGIMRNIYQSSGRQYQYASPAAAMSNAMNGIGRYTAATMNTMGNSPYGSMAAQFSTIPNSNSANINLRQVLEIFLLTKKKIRKNLKIFIFQINLFKI